MFLTLDMTFEEVAIGQEFYDDEGLLYVKLDEWSAELITEDEDEDPEIVSFGPMEIVDVDFEIEEFDD
jgi:hypothetical protein